MEHSKLAVCIGQTVGIEVGGVLKNQLKESDTLCENGDLFFSAVGLARNGGDTSQIVKVPPDVIGEEEEEIVEEEPIEEETEEVELSVLPEEYIEEEYQEEEEVEEVEEEEEDLYADKFTDEEIRSAYYNIPNFKEKFRELQREHEGLDIIKTKSIARGNNWKHEQECIDNADEYALERVQEIQVQGNVLQRYKEAIMYDCRVGYVSSMSDATLMGEQIWDVICDIEIPNTVVNE